ncbi:MAG: hypothetical protein JXL97_09020 [Bacteroidales bacterium]|nr:hypothetical protein [Bacteroidales bacterium]
MKRILFILFLFSVFNVFSQTEGEFFCASDNRFSLFNNKKWINNNDFLLEYIKNYPLLDSDYVYFRIPVVLHIYLNPREKKERIYPDIKRLIERLNDINKGNKTGFQFYLSDVIFINNQRHLKAGYIIEAPMISSKNQNKQAINIYYVNILQSKFFKNKTNYHGTYNSFNNSIISIRHASQTTLTHEIGHFFGLKHPHNHWKRGKSRQESVSRSQTKGLLAKKTVCEVNGDGLSDTPAEPNLSKFTDKDCNYIGEITDAWGEPYHPNTNNIMSYPGNRACRDNFTTMQKSVMLYTASHKKQSNIWSNTPENIHFTFDNLEPDDYFEMASEIILDENQYHTFHNSITYKRKLLKTNNTDFLTFSIKFNSQIFLNIEKGNYDFPTIEIIIYDVKRNVVFSKTISESIKIPLNNLNGKYFIRLVCINELPNGKLFDYQIVLREN